MAKNKHSVALFEVIQANRTSGGMDALRTPKWWFKKRPAGAPSSTNAPASAVATLPEPEPASVPAVFEPQNIDTLPASRAQGLDLTHDPQRQRISFHFTYNSAIILAFSVIVVVSLAYIVGQHMKQGPAQALAEPSTEQLLKGPAKSEVMGGSTASAGQPAAAARRTPPTAPEKPTTPAGGPTPIAKLPPVADNSATTAPSGQRVSSLNYIIVQGYPQSEKQMASDACDLLNKNGIPCTVETNVKGYPFYTVVTLRGFGRPSSPEYGAYEKLILALNEKFPKNSYKRFTPTAKKW